MPVRSRLRVPNKMQVLNFQTLAFFFFPFAPPNRLFSGQNQYFSKKFSVGPVSFVCLGAKLVKVGANGSLHRVLSLLFSSCPYLCGFLSCLHHKNIHKFSNNCTIGLTAYSEAVFTLQFFSMVISLPVIIIFSQSRNLH